MRVSCRVRKLALETRVDRARSLRDEENAPLETRASESRQARTSSSSEEPGRGSRRGNWGALGSAREKMIWQRGEIAWRGNAGESSAMPRLCARERKGRDKGGEEGE